MNYQAISVAALLAALPILPAQEEHAPPKKDKPAAKQTATQQPQSAKTKEHDALRALSGNWDVSYKMTEAGAAQPAESKGFERAELICDGMWLKSTTSGEMGGKPVQGLWLLGYDPHTKVYRGVCVDSSEPSPTSSEARYDESTKTWVFTGSTSKGTFKATAIVKDPDNIVETGTCTADGKETKFEITRKRSKAGMPMAASGKAGQALSNEQRELLRLVGDWDAAMKVSPEPGSPPAELPGTETVIPVCDDRYVWSDFRMLWQGKPFEGHALMGYDPAQKKYVSFWIDSMSPTLSESSGTYDAGQKALTLAGTSRDMNGNPTTTKEVSSWEADNTRHMRMECKGEKSESFEITFKRKGKS